MHEINKIAFSFEELIHKCLLNNNYSIIHNFNSTPDFVIDVGDEHNGIEVKSGGISTPGVKKLLDCRDCYDSLTVIFFSDANILTSYRNILRLYGIRFIFLPPSVKDIVYKNREILYKLWRDCACRHKIK